MRKTELETNGNETFAKVLLKNSLFFVDFKELIS
jgi:hypothetical protein